jgi:hypothetical protein
MRLWGLAGFNIRTEPRAHTGAPDFGERLETELALGVTGRGDRSQIQLGWTGDDTWRLGFQIRF